MSDDEVKADVSNSGDSSDEEKVEAQEEEGVTSQERTKIREQLSTMSFESLLKLKDEMGAKLYHETVFGVNKSKGKPTFKRANKNRPREISSKRRFKLENKIIPVKKQTPRDPRFDPVCGEFDRKTFKSNYKFVTELRLKEKNELEEELKQTTDLDRKKKIKFVMQRLDNQIREEEKTAKLEQRKEEEMKNIKDKLKRGEKVEFKKKSVKRLENLIDKYEELKKSNKLQKHLERRSKKLSAKDRKKKLIS